MAQSAFSVPRQWQDWLSWLLGIWLLLSPWTFAFDAETTAMRNAVVLGALIIIAEAFELSVFRDWEEWINVALGAWLLVSSWVLGMFGETDHLISIEDVRHLRDSLERHGRSFSIHVYRDAPHGLLNDTMPGRYRRAQAEAAWAEQRAFLEEVFAPGYDRSQRFQRYRADIAVDYDFSRNVRQE